MKVWQQKIIIGFAWVTLICGVLWVVDEVTKDKISQTVEYLSSAERRNLVEEWNRKHSLYYIMGGV